MKEVLESSPEAVGALLFMVISAIVNLASDAIAKKAPRLAAFIRAAGFDPKAAVRALKK